MFDANYLTCFDGIELVPGLVPPLVLTNKLKKDLKKEKIGDSKRRPWAPDPPPVFGAKSGSGWEGKRILSPVRCRQKVEKRKTGQMATRKRQ